MDKLRAKVTEATAKAQQSWQAPAEVEAASSHHALSNVRRRWTQTLMEKFGKAESTPDPEFDARASGIRDYEKLLEGLRSAAGFWLGAAHTQAATARQLGEALPRMYGQRGTGLQSVESTAGTLVALDGEGRAAFDNAFLSTVLVPLDVLLAAVKATALPIHERALLKTDYDARARVLEQMKVKGGRGMAGSPVDPTKILHKEAKLSATREALVKSTTSLYAAFAAIEEARYGGGEGTEGGGGCPCTPGSLPGIAQAWIALQYAWANSIAVKLAPLGTAPPGRLLPSLGLPTSPTMAGGLSPPPAVGTTTGRGGQDGGGGGGGGGGDWPAGQGPERPFSKTTTSRPLPGGNGTNGGGGRPFGAPGSFQAAAAAPVGASLGLPAGGGTHTRPPTEDDPTWLR